MSPELISFAQEASISVISIAALVGVVLIFIRYLQKREESYEQRMYEQSKEHAKNMEGRELAFRELEKEMRESLKEHLIQSSKALSESSEAIRQSAEVNRVSNIIISNHERTKENHSTPRSFPEKQHGK